ncbi:potassium transporter Kup [Poriferisphaera sp. WC338]|uniref:potassium transporter Kup n=1 Tax=Poriferisphaera sp. WC338 TaxID=3425129 RepID=UPI003D818C6A
MNDHLPHDPDNPEDLPHTQDHTDRQDGEAVSESSPSTDEDAILSLHTPQQKKRGPLIALTIGATGVVFGDIGTSPLYVLKACFSSQFAMQTSDLSIFGILSMIFWALLLVVSMKYILIIMRVNYEGEGGIFSLLSILRAKAKHTSRRTLSIITLGAIVGAALLYGDGVITPAISVISAVEGLDIASTELRPYIVPISAGILLALFLFQRFGIDRIGFTFGPLMVIWFITIGVLGFLQITKHPEILAAANPAYAVMFFYEHPALAFLVLGVVVLCITGGEALYADLGQFSHLSISIAWYAIVWPALLLNYFGQGALLLQNPNAANNPFFSLVPQWMLYPMVGLAATAAVIASQAIITGAFSLTKQAIHLDLLPPLKTLQTSHQISGRVYLPQINHIMMVICILIVIGFQSSDALAGAYGIAVTAVMVLTTTLFIATASIIWKRFFWLLLPVFVVIFFIDLSFFAANTLKIISGGWLPILIAIIIAIAMNTWRRGRKIVLQIRLSKTEKIAQFVQRIATEQPPRVKGTGAFLTVNPQRVPAALQKLYTRLPVLPEKIVIVSMIPSRQPRVARGDQLEVKPIGTNFWLVNGYYGYLQQPDVWRIFSFACKKHIPVDPSQTTFYMYHEYLLQTGKTKLWRWEKLLYIWLSRNAYTQRTNINLPTDRIIEIGSQTKI